MRSLLTVAVLVISTTTHAQDIPDCPVQYTSGYYTVSEESFGNIATRIHSDANNGIVFDMIVFQYFGERMFLHDVTDVGGMTRSWRFSTDTDWYASFTYKVHPWNEEPDGVGYIRVTDDEVFLSRNGVTVFDGEPLVSVVEMGDGYGSGSPVCDVPEPTAATLLLLGFLPILRFRRS